MIKLLKLLTECDDCIRNSVKSPLLLESKQTLSEGLQYHLDNKLPISQPIYRYGSESYFKLFKEVRQLFNEGKLELFGVDKEIITETDLGESFKHNSEILYLDHIYESEDDIYFENQDQKLIDKETLFNLLFSWAKEGKPFYGIYNPKNLMVAFEEDPSTAVSVLQSVKGGQEIPLTFYKSLQHYFPSLPDQTSINEVDKKTPPLNKPKRGGSKKFYVYVRDPKTKKIKKVSFGAAGGGQNLRVKINDPKARRLFADRQNCHQKNDKTKPGYWSCRLPRYAKLLGLKSNYSGFW